MKHTDAENVKKAVYGLPESFREQIKGKDLIANPGCYPTGALLAMGDPGSGEMIIEKVFKREELYRGPHYNEGPDLVAIPHNGYQKPEI